MKIKLEMLSTLIAMLDTKAWLERADLPVGSAFVVIRDLDVLDPSIPTPVTGAG